MKIFHRHQIKCLGILLISLAYSVTALGYECYDYIFRKGLVYEICYDSDTPWMGTASLISCASSMGLENEYPIEYDWEPDSIIDLPTEVENENGIYTLTSIMGLGGCNELKVVYVPPTVTRIGMSAFAGTSLESIYFYDDSFLYPNSDPITFVERETYMESTGGSAFQDCKRLKTVEFKRPINQVTTYMFMGCSQLETVTFHHTNVPLDKIGTCAFANCVSLKKFSIPRSVKVIGNGAFANCINLENIYPSSDITSIGDYAFAECHLLNNINNSLSSVQSIGKAAFLNCWSLTYLYIPNVTTIKDFTFYDCRNLSSINLNRVTSFGECAFAGCNKLTSVDLTRAQSIGVEAFSGGKVACQIWSPEYFRDSTYLGISCREDRPTVLEGSLKQINLGNAITILNNYTFSGHIPDTVTCMAPTPPTYNVTPSYDWVFNPEAYANSVLCVPQVVVNDYREAFGWSKFVNIKGIVIFGDGDVNGDGQLTIGDVTVLIDQLLGSQPTTFNPVNADVNGDGNVTIADVTALIDKLLSGQ